MNKRTSLSTERLIESLYAKRPAWRRLFGGPDAEQTIRVIADEGDVAAIPDLLPLLIVGDKPSILASGKAIHHLLQHLRPSDYADFDEFVRQSWHTWQMRREPWYVMKPQDVTHLANIGEPSVSLLGIASCHANGHVREAAVRELTKYLAGAELPFLLLRVNDWVPQIRSIAREALFGRIRAEYIAQIAGWMPLVLRLGFTAREDHSAIVDAARRLFARAEAVEIVDAGFRSTDRFFRRFCFQVALDWPLERLPVVLQRALASADIQVRMNAMRKLPSILPSSQGKDLLIRARNDGYMPVRREALHIFVEQYPTERDQQFEAALLDRHISIRRTAQHYFADRKLGDLLGYYSRKLLTSRGRGLSAAIAGLGETGVSGDSHLVEPFFKDHSSAVRVAAIRAAGKLDPHAYLEVFLLALCDPSSAVGREAALSLCKLTNALDGSRLWEIFETCCYPHGRRKALSLMARLNKWESIRFLIQSLQNQDESSLFLSRRYLSRWFARYNRSYLAPTPDQLSKIREVFDRCHLLLDHRAERELVSILKGLENRR